MAEVMTRPLPTPVLEDTNLPQPPEDETVLVVDDDANTRESLELALDKNGYKVLSAADAREALGILDRSPVDVVVTDLRMPDLDGLQFYQFVRQRAPSVPVIMISGQASVEAAVSAMRDGV